MRVPRKDVPRYPLVVDAGGFVPRLHDAIASPAVGGTCMVAAMYFGETAPLPLYKMYFKGMRWKPDARTPALRFRPQSSSSHPDDSNPNS